MPSLERELTMRNKKLYPEEEEIVDAWRAGALKLSAKKDERHAAMKAISEIEEKNCMAAIPLKVEAKSAGMEKILQYLDPHSPFPSAPKGGKSILYQIGKAMVLQANDEAK